MELLSPGHLIPLLIIAAILFFGWKQLPDMARSVGRSLRIFKTEMKGMTQDDVERELAANPAPAATVEPPALPAQTTPPAPAAPPAAAPTPTPAPAAPPAAEPASGESSTAEPGSPGLRAR